MCKIPTSNGNLAVQKITPKEGTKTKLSKQVEALIQEPETSKDFSNVTNQTKGTAQEQNISFVESPDNIQESKTDKVNSESELSQKSKNNKRIETAAKIGIVGSGLVTFGALMGAKTVPLVIIGVTTAAILPRILDGDKAAMALGVASAGGLITMATAATTGFLVLEKTRSPVAAAAAAITISLIGGSLNGEAIDQLKK